MKMAIIHCDEHTHFQADCERCVGMRNDAVTSYLPDSRKVITYRSTNGARINLTDTQIKMLKAAAVWPKDSTGTELCQVSHGLHHGAATYTDDELLGWIKQQRA